jgi:ABC-2 type transport system permease protein
MPGLIRTARATHFELYKLFAQRGSYAAFVVVLVVVALVVYGTWRHGPDIDAMRQVGGDQMLVAGNVLTAPFVLQFMLAAIMEVLMPLLVAAVGGGLLAAEIRAGTMRTLMMRPLTRLDVLAAKLAAGWIYTLALCAFVALAAATMGYAAFGPGDMVSVMGGAGNLVIFSHEEALGRLALAYAFAALGRCVILTLAVMLSCLFDNALTAAALTVAFLIGFGILESIPYFETWKPYFLNTQLSVYRMPLAADLDWPGMASKLWGMAAYTVGAIVVAAAVFTRRDITT